MNSLIHRTTKFLPGSCCIPQNTAHRLGSSKPFWSSFYSLNHPLWLREQPAANVAKHQHSQELENLDPSQCSPDPWWDAHLVNSLITGVLQPQVNHRVLQRPPHVEFQGEVINPLQEKNHPVVTFPRAGGDSPGLQKLLLGDISKTNREKTAALNRAGGGLHQEFQGCGSCPALLFFPKPRRSCLIWTSPFAPSQAWGQLQDGHPTHTGGSTKLNFKKEQFPHVAAKPQENSESCRGWLWGHGAFSAVPWQRKGTHSR